ncbi:hypothetical protein DY000_02007474 [Brassica cretica]|uniref:Uncharacterized protein n=1 Tax=Brassica cretica TaxID=69181 RepID=A0ABQ7C9A4_BRACR|nr:hypothetical protein DY000_02007474 [Brassica cretica]
MEFLSEKAWSHLSNGTTGKPTEAAPASPPRHDRVITVISRGLVISGISQTAAKKSTWNVKPGLEASKPKHLLLGPSLRRLTRAPQGDRSPWATDYSTLAVTTGDRLRLPRGHHGRPACVSLAVAHGDRHRLPRGRHRRSASPTSRSPRATGVVYLAVSTGDRRRLPRGHHGRLASPEDRKRKREPT